MSSLSSPQHLVEIHGKYYDACGGGPHTIDTNVMFYNNEHYRYYEQKSYKCLLHIGKYLKGCSHGQLVVLGAHKSHNCELCGLPYMSSRGLLDWDRRIVFKAATLTSFHSAYNVMALTGSSSLAFAFYRCLGWGISPSSNAWTIKNCDIKKPYALSQNMQFSNAIGFKGRFYALSLQGCVVVIEEVNSCFEITRISAKRAVPCKASRQFMEYLVESDGEVLLVFLISRKSIDFVVDVEVFRLDVEKLLWVKVERLGDRALFFEDECCMWVIASKVGVVDF